MNGSESVRWINRRYTHSLQSIDDEEIGTLSPLIMNIEIGSMRHVFVMRTFDEENSGILDKHYYIDEANVKKAKELAERIVYKKRAHKLQRDIDQLKVHLARTEALLEDTD